MTIQEFKKYAIDNLTSSPSPQLDGEVLLEHFLKVNRTYLLLNRNTPIQENILNQLMEAVSKRKTGLPIAYITGIKEFYGYSFHVNPSVLIPKPDTEILVEKATEHIKTLILDNPSRNLKICDMCTGSGCIAISIIKNLSSLGLTKLPDFYLVDISLEALKVAESNIQSLLSEEEQKKTHIINSNLFENVDLTFDCIVTNPPYIPHTLVDKLLLDGRNEPRLALDGDVNEHGKPVSEDDGLSLIKRLLIQVREHLQEGMIFMETGEYNAELSLAYALSLGYKSKPIIRDLEGDLRVVNVYI